MHSSKELTSSSFRIEVDGRQVRLEDLFEGFGERDRLGVVVGHPCGAVGASGLITATVTAFYDIQRSHGPDFFIYPDYFLFHVGRAHGNHGMLDVWPDHKEVVVPDDPERILQAINDRGITRLAVEDDGGAPEGGAGPAPEFERQTLASARDRIVTCLAYSPSGRLGDGDVKIATGDVTEGYVGAVLDPAGHVARLREGDGGGNGYANSIEARASEVEQAVRERIRDARNELVEDGRPVETYRRIGLDEALGRLG
jgi:hypothetical protein